ncbi:MAG: hypothetical protein JXA09_11975 [Anaerolineae bacterium]|nr:hypothetical protein [Anaerolineae bacterium]
MKKGDKRKQRKAVARQARRGRSGAPGRGEPSVRQALRRAGEYPIVGCWTREDWDGAGLTPVVIARRQPDGRIAWGAYIVDLFCLGLKDTYCNVNYSRRRFYDELLPGVVVGGAPHEITPALAHELVYGAIEYAGQFGFRAHRDFRDSRYLLDPPNAHPRSGTVTFGHEGKPLFIQGPYDNAEAIVHQLQRTAGEGNFDYIVFAGERSALNWDEEGDEQEDEDWDEDQGWEEVEEEE